MNSVSEKLEGEKLNVAEVTQSEIAQKQKLQTVLERINDSLKLSTRNIRWNVDCKEDLHSSFPKLDVPVGERITGGPTWLFQGR